jgi:hypothetical protein
VENGLTLVVNASGNDYFYPVMNTIGVTIQVFSPPDYPDILTGRVLLDIVNRGVEKHLGLRSSYC